ncbi:MAG: DndE family protein [Bacteroidia bacterium]|nr:DndE family protein [Bacteroidia bacterium]
MDNFTIRIDQETTLKLDRITQLYNFKRDTITARIAFSLSVNNFKKKSIEDSLVQDGRKYTNTSNLFGNFLNNTDNSIIYKSILNQIYEEDLNENEFLKLFRIHVKEGINTWDEKLNECDITKGEHISYLLNLINKGLIKRSSNVYIDKNQISNPIGFNIQGTLNELNLSIGKDSDDNEINLKINNETEYTSRHFAIAGTTGSGKTQLVFDLINQLSTQSNKELKFTFFDFKGTDSEEKLKPFLNSTSANFINVTHQDGFPFSPLKNYDLSNQNYIESFASDLRTFFKDIRQVQSASLVRHIIEYHFDYKKSPALNELLENLLENNNGKFDTTTSVIQQLINSRIYDESKTYDIFKQSNYISMPSDVTKEIKQFVTFNLLKYMYDTIKKSGDSKVVNNIKELKHVIIIDEAQNFLQHKNARPVIESMLRELRSMGIVIILIAQETQDFIYSDFDFMSQIKFSICCDVRDKSPKRIIPFIGSVNSELKLKSQLDKLESGKGIINVGEPKLIELRQWWKTLND